MVLNTCSASMPMISGTAESGPQARISFAITVSSESLVLLIVSSRCLLHMSKASPCMLTNFLNIGRKRKSLGGMNISCWTMGKPSSAISINLCPSPSPLIAPRRDPRKIEPTASRANACSIGYMSSTDPSFKLFSVEILSARSPAMSSRSSM